MPPACLENSPNGAATISAGFASPMKAGKVDNAGLSTHATPFTPGPSGGRAGNAHPTGPHSSEECAEEVAAAASWWTQSMRQEGLAQSQVRSFEEALKRGLSQRCEGHWYAAEPMRGSGHRSVINDVTVDPILKQAAEASSISHRDAAGRLPRCIVWCNPGCVRVQMKNEHHACTVFSSSSPGAPSSNGSGSDSE